MANLKTYKIFKKMKNSIKVSLLALLFTVGIGGAIVQKIQAAPKAADQLYNWVHYDTDGVTVIPGTENGKSVSQAQADFSCSGSGNRCAEGTATGKPNVVIRYQ
ncbi:hypothetical protein [Mucilaginibacter sp. UYCu711]|uniref:hypothetical protein n=1 Tax=Mucilaginibacter sp. UYCu711 TaxID=3156339 RepID=UPI003D1AA1D9